MPSIAGRAGKGQRLLRAWPYAAALLRLHTADCTGVSASPGTSRWSCCSSGGFALGVCLVESSSVAERTSPGSPCDLPGRHGDSACKCVSLNFLNLGTHPQRVACVCKRSSDWLLTRVASVGFLQPLLPPPPAPSEPPKAAVLSTAQRGSVIGTRSDCFVPPSPLSPAKAPLAAHSKV